MASDPAAQYIIESIVEDFSQTLEDIRYVITEILKVDGLSHPEFNSTLASICSDNIVRRKNIVGIICKTSAIITNGSFSFNKLTLVDRFWSYLLSQPLDSLREAGLKLALKKWQTGIGRGFYIVEEVNPSELNIDLTALAFGVPADDLSQTPRDDAAESSIETQNDNESQQHDKTIQENVHEDLPDSGHKEFHSFNSVTKLFGLSTEESLQDKTLEVNASKVDDITIDGYLSDNEDLSKDGTSVHESYVDSNLDAIAHQGGESIDPSKKELRTVNSLSKLLGLSTEESLLNDQEPIMKSSSPYLIGSDVDGYQADFEELSSDKVDTVTVAVTRKTESIVEINHAEGDNTRRAIDGDPANLIDDVIPAAAAEDVTNDDTSVILNNEELKSLPAQHEVIQPLQIGTIDIAGENIPISIEDPDIVDGYLFDEEMISIKDKLNVDDGGSIMAAMEDDADDGFGDNLVSPQNRIMPTRKSRSRNGSLDDYLFDDDLFLDDNNDNDNSEIPATAHSSSVSLIVEPVRKAVTAEVDLSLDESDDEGGNSWNSPTFLKVTKDFIRASSAVKAFRSSPNDDIPSPIASAQNDDNASENNAGHIEGAHVIQPRAGIPKVSLQSKSQSSSLIAKNIEALTRSIADRSQAEDSQAKKRVTSINNDLDDDLDGNPSWNSKQFKLKSAHIMKSAILLATATTAVDGAPPVSHCESTDGNTGKEKQTVTTAASTVAILRAMVSKNRGMANSDSPLKENDVGANADGQDIYDDDFIELDSEIPQDINTLKGDNRDGLESQAIDNIVRNNSMKILSYEAFASNDNDDSNYNNDNGDGDRDIKVAKRKRRLKRRPKSAVDLTRRERVEQEAFQVPSDVVFINARAKRVVQKPSSAAPIRRRHDHIDSQSSHQAFSNVLNSESTPVGKPAIDLSLCLKKLEQNSSEAIRIMEELDNMWRMNLRLSIKKALKELDKRHLDDMVSLNKRFQILDINPQVYTNLSAATQPRDKTIPFPLLTKQKSADDNEHAKKIIGSYSEQQFKKYFIVRHKLVDGHATERRLLEQSIEEPLKLLDKMRDEYIASIESSVTRTMSAVEHSRRLTAAAGQGTGVGPLTTLRADKALHNAYNTYRQSLSDIAKICADLRMQYTVVETDNGPFQAAVNSAKLHENPLSVLEYPAALVMKQRPISRKATHLESSHGETIKKKKTKKKKKKKVSSKDTNNRSSGNDVGMDNDAVDENVEDEEDSEQDEEIEQERLESPHDRNRPQSAPSRPAKSSTIESSATGPTCAGSRPFSALGLQFLQRAASSTSVLSHFGEAVVLPLTHGYNDDSDGYILTDNYQHNEQESAKDNLDEFQPRPRLARATSDIIGAGSPGAISRSSSRGVLYLTFEETDDNYDYDAEYDKRISGDWGRLVSVEEKEKDKRKLKKHVFVCVSCHDKFSGRGKTLPSSNSLDKKAIRQHRKQEAVLTAKALQSDSLDPKQRAFLEQRELYRVRYGHAPGDEKEFCSWECMKRWVHEFHPFQFRYSTDKLIDLHAGYFVEVD